MSLPLLLALLAAPAFADEPSPPTAEGTTEGDAASLPVDATFAAFFEAFKAAVAAKDRDAVAGMTRFPFYSWDLPLPKEWQAEFAGGPAVLERDRFLAIYPRLFDAKARRRIATNTPTIRDEDTDDPYYSLGIWRTRTYMVWLDFARDEAGAWHLIKTDNVSF